MNEQQPEALRLAQFALDRQTHIGPRRPFKRSEDDTHGDQWAWDQYDALAAELRRLHATNTQAARLLLDYVRELATLRAQVERLQSDLDANAAAFDTERTARLEAQAQAKTLTAMVERLQAAGQVVAWRVKGVAHHSRSEFTAGQPAPEHVKHWADLGATIEYAYAGPPAVAQEAADAGAHKAGCPAEGGYGNGPEPCICGADTGADERELMTKLHAQIRHLIDDLTTVVEDDGLTRYVTAHGGGMLYSNFINALIPLAKRLGAALAARAGQVAAPAMVPLAEKTVGAPFVLPEYLRQTWAVSLAGPGSGSMAARLALVDQLARKAAP